MDFRSIVSPLPTLPSLSEVIKPILHEESPLLRPSFTQPPPLHSFANSIPVAISEKLPASHLPQLPLFIPNERNHVEFEEQADISSLTRLQASEYEDAKRASDLLQLEMKNFIEQGGKKKQKKKWSFFRVSFSSRFSFFCFFFSL
jgi:hypothetical protein